MTIGHRFDVMGIGNAIVDVMTRCNEDFLAEHGLTKGSMRLIDADQATRIYGEIGPATESSGGSAGNTVAGIASLGGRAAFIGKVADDELGRIYRHDMTGVGVTYETPPLEGNLPTARSIIMVTPDGQRTMNTYLGAAQALGPEDIDDGLIAESAIVFLEGYLWDPPNAKDAFRRAAKVAHDARRAVALTLSDSMCVDRYRDEFLELIRTNQVDIVLANEAELKSLYETSDLQAALDTLRDEISLAAVTVSERGSYVISSDGIDHVPVSPVDQLVDTTGAGDLYASGFLLGVARGLSFRKSAALGSFAAAEVISHVGARPLITLAPAARAAGYSY